MINYDYFDVIDTENKAYWLGFLFADGNITTPYRVNKDGSIKNGIYRIEISLKEEDKDHLDMLRKELNVEKPLNISKTNYNGANRCRLYFNSKHLWEVLNSYGCTPKKSLTLTFPPISIFKDKSLIKHFIRGYFDGDGCLSWCDTDHKRAHVGVLGTVKFLTELQHWLPLEFENIVTKRVGENVASLYYAGKTAFYVSNYLYKNCSVYLQRKRERYLEYCRLYLEEYGLQLGKYGELWEENTVVNSEISKGSESPYSVEGE